MEAFFRGSQTINFVTCGFKRSYSQAAEVPSSNVTCKSPRSPSIHCRIMLAFVSMTHSITIFPAAFITAIEMLSLCTSIPIYLVLVIKGVLSGWAEPNTQNPTPKGAPFYIASDRPTVPAKSPNNAGQPVAEGMEGRGLAKGNLPQQNASRTPSRNDASSALERVRQAAGKDKKLRFTALLHHIYNLETLRMAYFSLKKEAAPGVDGETWRHYGEALEDNLQDLSHRLKRGAYRAKPVRRAYIDKRDGRKRPLGVPVLEDKVVQRATVEVLNAIYETDFLGFSYGFRTGRSQHNALDALYTGLLTKKVNWVLDVDIRSFFDGLSHEWLVKFVEHRVADRRVVRLIQKWLNAGVLEDGRRTQTEEGTPQGGSASPLLANVYLHYVFDLWVQAWRQKRAHGDVIV